MKYEWLAYGGRHLHAPDPMAPALRVTDVSVGYPGVQTPGVPLVQAATDAWQAPVPHVMLPRPLQAG